MICSTTSGRYRLAGPQQAELDQVRPRAEDPEPEQRRHLAGTLFTSGLELGGGLQRLFLPHPMST
jgi:hypothetical protein